jgi:hypothetical protein
MMDGVKSHSQVAVCVLLLALLFRSRASPSLVYTLFTLLLSLFAPHSVPTAMSH